MTERRRRWSIEAVDARLAHPDRDLDVLATELGVPVEQVARFAKVRDALLAGRKAEGLRESDLLAARVQAGDVTAYMQVSDRILELARNERDRSRSDSGPQRCER